MREGLSVPRHLACRQERPTSYGACPPYQAGRLSRHPLRRAFSGPYGQSSVFSYFANCSLLLNTCQWRHHGKDEECTGEAPFTKTMVYLPVFGRLTDLLNKGCNVSPPRA